MDQDEMVLIAEKIKKHIATPEEILAFSKEFKKLVAGIKEDLQTA